MTGMASVSTTPMTAPAPQPRFNVPLPTLGGKQLWADVRHFHGWRIQRHVYRERYRLLDEWNIRRAWGDRAACAAALAQVAQHERIPPMRGPGVVLLHGLIRTRTAMGSLARFLARRGFSVFNVSYPSTRAEVAWHAQNLAEIVRHLDGIKPLHFVGHSLGNLVIRHYFGDELAAHGRIDARIGRMVMLAPPNQGAEIARRVVRLPILSTIFGPAGKQLSRTWTDLEPRLAIPPCEFGVLAGARGIDAGRNPLLTGDDDLVVAVEETKLYGMDDFALVPARHTFFMNHRRVQQATLNFLQHGQFE